MAEFKNPLGNIKVVYTRTHPLTKVVVIALIVLSMAALIALGWSSSEMNARIEDMRAEVAQLEAENAELREKIEELGSVQSVMDIAQEELDLVDPDTVVIEPSN